MSMDDREFVSGTEDQAGEPLQHHKLELGGMTPTDDAVHVSQDLPSRTLWGDAWGRLKRNKLAVAGVVYLIIISILAITGPLWMPKVFGDPLYTDTTTMMQRRLLQPSLQHPMGTDDLGRDEFSRVVYGARVSLSIGIVATGLSILLGLLMGGLSGYYGGFTDSAIMRLTDVFLAFPYILFAILLISVMGTGVMSLVVAIGILGWTTIARVFRSSILSVKENEYVDAAKAMGGGSTRILTRHIMPNSVAPIIVYATMSIGGVILSEAALSFLGLGVQPPTPSWGRMLNESQNYMTTYPWLFIWPGLAILLTVLAFVLVGDGLRDALDVKMKD